MSELPNRINRFTMVQEEIAAKETQIYALEHENLLINSAENLDRCYEQFGIKMKSLVASMQLTPSLIENSVIYLQGGDAFWKNVLFFRETIVLSIIIQFKS